MDRQKDKSEQNEQRKDGSPPEQNAAGAGPRADSGQEHLGQSFVTWANAGILGFHMISGPLLGIFLGYYLDKWLDSSPVCVGIGLALGLVAGALNMYRDMRRFLREQAAEDAREKLRRMGLGKDETSRRQDGGPRVSARTAEREASDEDGGGKPAAGSERGENGDSDDDDYSDPSSGYGRGEGERK